MRWLVTALAATLLMGVNGRIDVSRRGRLDVMLPASGINPITEQPHVVIGPPISGYHAETLDYIARVEAAGGGLTPTQESAIDTFVRSAHSGGWRYKIIRASPLLGTNLASALVPLFFATTSGIGTMAGGASNDISVGYVEGDYISSGGISDAEPYSKWVNLTVTNFLAFGTGTSNGHLAFGCQTRSNLALMAAINAGPFNEIKPAINAGWDFHQWSFGKDGYNHVITTTTNDPQIVSATWDADGVDGYRNQSFVRTNAAYGYSTFSTNIVSLCSATSTDGHRGFLGVYNFYSLGMAMTEAEHIAMQAAWSNLNATVGR